MTSRPHLQVGYAITKMPEGFHLHKGVKRVYDQRRQMIETGEGVDWGMAEALAFGTLLSEGVDSFVQPQILKSSALMLPSASLCYRLCTF